MHTDGRMDKDVVDIYNGVLLSHKFMPFAATWIYLEIVILSEVKQRRINTWYCLYVESKKNVQMNLFMKQKQVQNSKK